MASENIQNMPQEQLIMPTLRQDLSITSSSLEKDGSQNWVLYDPLKNKYYRLGNIAFAILSHWEAGMPAEKWLQSKQQRENKVEKNDLEQIILFLTANNLIVSSDPQTLRCLKQQHDAGNKKQGLFSWLLSHYLYIRIPLFNPDRFLSATLPYTSIFFTSFFKWIVRFLGVIGLILISRRWEEFSGSFLHFFTVSGAIIFSASLFIVKTLHELGHAYTAKRQGCRIPCMGIALIVLYPLLYTDTTDAWRLPSSKQRLAIVTAGVKTELAFACIACFTWNFLEAGIIQSIMFIIATTSLISSLGINMMPFMRFDGYYALSDILGAENLQARSFVLGRWKLRELLFGLKTPPPEALPPGKQNIFILYAYSTWIYRFMLFMGIALMVYHFAFKALGIILFVTELYCFIMRPIIYEFHTWIKNRDRKMLNFRSAFTLVFFSTLVTPFFIPWENNIALPAVLETDQKGTVYAAENGIISAVQTKEGNTVTKGQVLFNIAMPELEKETTMLKRKATYLQMRLDRHISSTNDLNNLDVILKQLARVKTDLFGLEERMNRGQIKATSNGRISKLTEIPPGQWVSQNSLMAEIISEQWTHITAYLREDQIHRINEESTAFFYSDSDNRNPIEGTIIKISTTSVGTLPHPELTSIYGGPIAVRQLSNNYYRPEMSLYRVVLKTKKQVEKNFQRTAGHVFVQATAESPFARAWRYATSVFIRESEL